MANGIWWTINTIYGGIIHKNRFFEHLLQLHFSAFKYTECPYSGWISNEENQLIGKLPLKFEIKGSTEKLDFQLIQFSRWTLGTFFCSFTHFQPVN